MPILLELRVDHKNVRLVYLHSVLYLYFRHSAILFILFITLSAATSPLLFAVASITNLVGHIFTSCVDRHKNKNF